MTSPVHVCMAFMTENPLETALAFLISPPWTLKPRLFEFAYCLKHWKEKEMSTKSNSRTINMLLSKAPLLACLLPVY